MSERVHSRTRKDLAHVLKGFMYIALGPAWVVAISTFEVSLLLVTSM